MRELKDHPANKEVRVFFPYDLTVNNSANDSGQ